MAKVSINFKLPYCYANTYDNVIVFNNFMLSVHKILLLILWCTILKYNVRLYLMKQALVSRVN